MKTIGDFFKKFSHIKPTARVIRKIMVSILDKKNIPITEDEIVYSSGIIYIKSNQSVKNEVFILKQTLLKELEEGLNRKTVTDIR
ncbi:MAG: hypothetical protein WD509_01205 [Candidatus Paceibacterota bacterium]